MRWCLVKELISYKLQTTIMDIVWVTRGFPYPPDSGDRIVVYNWITRLSDRGHDIHLLASVPEAPDGEKIDELSSYVSSIEYFIDAQSVTDYITSLLQPLTPYIIQLCRSPQLEEVINHIVENNDIDAIFVDHTHVSGYRDSKEPKSILGVHNLEYKWYWNTAKLAFPKPESIAYAIETVRMDIYEKRLFRNGKFDCYEFVSHSELEWVEDLNPNISNRLEWSPIGIDTTRFDSTDPANLTQRCPTIVFTGTMSSHLNTDAVKWFSEDIFPEIKAKVPEAQFVIIGKNPSQSVRNISNQNDDVIVTGGVEKIEPYLVGADLVVIPLRGGAGVKIKLLEGLATGNLVLTTDYGIQGTAITPGKEVLLANKAKKFADLAAKSLNHPGEFKHIGQNGREYVQKNHDWNSIIDRLEVTIKTTNK